MTPYSLSEIHARKIAQQIDFAKASLLPAITVQYDTGELLMQAWMNEAALLETLTSGTVCYYSRSKQALWRKGESSGHVQTLMSLRIDCDKDSIMLLVNQVGAACHTYRRNCFFYQANKDGEFDVIAKPLTVD